MKTIAHLFVLCALCISIPSFSSEPFTPVTGVITQIEVGSANKGILGVGYLKITLEGISDPFTLNRAGNESTDNAAFQEFYDLALFAYHQGISVTITEFNNNPGLGYTGYSLSMGRSPAHNPPL